MQVVLTLGADTLVKLFRRDLARFKRRLLQTTLNQLLPFPRTMPKKEAKDLRNTLLVCVLGDGSDVVVAEHRVEAGGPVW
jgi:hypothetical protein